MTNGNANANDDYVVQIKLKELVVFQQQLSFAPSSVTNLTVLARQFPLINGGVLSVNLYRLTQQLDTFYKSRNNASSTNGTTSNNSTNNSTGNSTNNSTRPINGTNTTTNGTNSTTGNSTNNTTRPTNGTNTTTGNTTNNTTRPVNGTNATNGTNSTSGNSTNNTRPTNGTTNSTNGTSGGNTTNNTNTTRPINGTNGTTNGSTGGNTTTNTTNNTTPQTFTPPDWSTTAQVAQFFESKGELIFFKRPNDQFRLNITLDRSVYSAGDNVAYTIRILNATTGAVITTDAFVTVTAVDVLGYTRPNGDLGLPAPLQVRTHLSQEVRNFDNERVNSLQGLVGAFQGNDTRYIDLLFGLQSWRQGLFDVRSLVALNQQMANLSQADRQAINGLYNFVLDRNVAVRAANATNTTNTTTNPPTNSTSGNTTTNTTNNGTRPNNTSNSTTNNTGNSTTNNTNTNNTNNNATNTTNNTTPQPTVVVSVRSGELAFENDATDYMTGIINPRNWTKTVRANFTAGQVDDLTATVLF